MSEDKNQRARKLANRYAAAAFGIASALFVWGAWALAPWLGVFAAAIVLFFVGCVFALVSEELRKEANK